MKVVLALGHAQVWLAQRYRRASWLTAGWWHLAWLPVRLLFCGLLAVYEWRCAE